MMYDWLRGSFMSNFQPGSKLWEQAFFFPFLQLSSYYERLKVRFRQTLLDSQKIQNETVKAASCSTYVYYCTAVEERREGLSCGLDAFACLSYSYCCLNIEFLKCLILKFLSLLMPTYCKHCQGDPLNLNTYLHPLVTEWTPSGSLMLLPKGYYIFGQAGVFSARAKISGKALGLRDSTCL